MRKPRIDLNCDMGESYGAWQMGQDAQVLRHVTSANIACGMHAGDPLTMQRTVAAAVAQGVAIGAHPSLPDLQGFGRRVMAITANEAYALTLYQIGALSAFAHAAASRLHHVKPHGALYNMAARDTTLAQAIAQAVRDADAALILVGLAGSALPAAGAALGLKVGHEAFADRRYEADTSLTPRGEKDAVIHDIDVAIAQALSIVTQANVTTRDGKILSLQADTICVHGDRADAAMFAERLRAALDQAGIGVRTLDGAGA
ncbi:LamB/YcsF family protein [Pseudolysobacter antarcticus]|uniref:5-oxoprolinase subunit A n=1 Tax=Pseudolysobacter antarcticus TaxID=2511995 RepID=A0A411HLJ6_9GAMM|nr:5-oxoprolinase subunit PxpA [Pseudolysobacter antarcticus]QBB71399.1 LamB/YcsF family protein [Pseudolysobacter antarcticus]